MEKWTIRPSPAPFDPHRHVLLIRGEMKDISLILKKFGALCGRPTPVKEPEGYNFSLHLHGMTERGMDRLTAALDEMLPRQEGTEAWAAAVLEAASPAPPAEEAPELIPLTPEPSAFAPLPEPEPAPAIATPEPEPAVSAPPALWGLAEKLDERLNLDSLTVGPFNRFAHAAATSVVGSPGTMYNPLFLHGPPGVGKSHMLHAIGLALVGGFSEEEIVLTSGPRLAHAASFALAEGRSGEIEAFLKNAKALLVDDVHLLAVTEENRAFLAKVFDLFFSGSLQVVMTSLYPPRGLAALEEA